jgi:small-conductance mechanosensitive channel
MAWAATAADAPGGNAQNNAGNRANGAATTGASSDADTDATLDRIRQQIDAMQKALLGNVADADLLRLRTDALAAQTQAAQIVTDLAPQFTSLQARLALLGTPPPGTKEDPDVASQRVQLTKSSNTLDGQLKLARLLAVEGGQIAAQTWELRRSQFQAHLGERTTSILGKPFWTELADDAPRDGARLAALGRELATSARSVPWWVWGGALVGIAALFWARALAEKRLLPWVIGHTPGTRLRRSLYALIGMLLWTLAVGASATLLHGAIDWTATLSPDTEALLGGLAGLLWLGGYIFGLADALISADRPSWRLAPVPDPVAASLRWFPAEIAVAAVVSWLAEHLAALVNASLAVTVAVNCLVALGLALTLGLALLRSEHRWHLELQREGAQRRPLWMAIVASLNWLVLVASFICLLGGWVAFGNFAVKQLVWAAILAGSTYLFAAAIDDAFMTWLGARRPEPASADAEAVPIVAARARDQAAVLLSALCRLTLLMVALILLLAPFGEGPSDLLRRTGQWQQGIAIGEVTLRPAAVLQALLVLLAGVAIVRGMRRWLANHYLPTTSLDPGMRQSAASLFGYGGMVIAAGLAMSALGIGLERVAWVASALSVGIGFGLQAVVQNFVSGLILLAERPVKVGDWVSLGGVEGDIRRINVRATEIQMGDRSTVIVPNSEFITKVVRNVTMADAMGLVQLKLPVPLANDAERVRELMLEAFHAHGDVLATPAPAVLLDGVDTANLLFNATGFVPSPRMVAAVRSALLFDVLQRLREAGIKLASPPTLLLEAPAPVPTPGG